MAELPRGTVTLLFTDIEGSTRLLQELGDERYVRALEDHRRLLRDAFTGRGGVEVEMQGDSFHYAFAAAAAAVLAAADAQHALAEHAWESEPIRVRIGIHTGKPLVTGHLYAGLDVHRAARVMSAGHGGQVLFSETTRSALPDGLSLRDLGEHRLKDLSARQRLYQLGETDFPPLSTLYRTNLPVPATPFIGRERELQELSALLTDDGVRLLTLTGAGGSGKTRLAAQAAADVSEDYPDGVFWVSLAALRDPALVTATIAQALDSKGDLAEHMGSKRLLLLLDNFEHVVAAATELAGLVAACARLTLLVTSREPLHLRSEREYTVMPLRETDAVCLFHERVRATGTEVAVDAEVAEICRRLDHLPLAIELAAARAKVLTPRVLLERLGQRLPLLTAGPRDLPERQRTLRSTISWSHDLLDPDEQRLFARLAVFSGGCTLEAAEAVSDATVDRLQSLVEKSLLRRTDERFWMLETIREYAVERLDASGEKADLRRWHAEFFVDLAERARPGLEGRDQPTWLQALSRDYDNLIAALEWALDRCDADVALRFVATLGWLWFLRGPVAAGRSFIDRTLAAAPDAPTEIRADVVVRAANLAQAAGDLEQAAVYYEEALDLRRGLGDRRGTIRLLGNLGIIAQFRGDYSRAAHRYAESEALALELGDVSGRAAALCNFGMMRLEEGKPAEAEALLERSLPLARELEHAFGLAVIHRGLAHAALDQGETERAAELLRITLDICCDLDSTGGIATCFNSLAEIEVARGNDTAAARLLGAGASLNETTGLTPTPHEQASTTRAMETAQARLGDAEFEEAWSDGRSMSVEHAVAWAGELRRAGMGAGAALTAD